MSLHSDYLQALYWFRDNPPKNLPKAAQEHRLEWYDQRIEESKRNDAEWRSRIANTSTGY